MTILLGIFEEGFVYAIMALGVYITYKILDFPDLSVDGTFPLGAAVTAALITKGVNPLLALLCALAAGAAAGAITGFIHVKLKVRDLLCGIIVMTALYSVSLRIAGSANVAMFSRETLFSNSLFDNILSDGIYEFATVIILFVLVIILKLLMDRYLKTRSGFLLRAAGDNDVVVTSLGKDKGAVKILGLVIANALAALSGSVYCQMNGFFEISVGTGTIVIGLASVIIGTSIFRKASFMKATTAVIIGSVLYKACVSAAIALGMNASDLKLITAVLFLIILVLAQMNSSKNAGHKKAIAERKGA